MKLKWWITHRVDKWTMNGCGEGRKCYTTLRLRMPGALAAEFGVLRKQRR